MPDRIYSEFSKKEKQQQIEELAKKYSENDENWGVIEHPPQLTLLDKI